MIQCRLCVSPAKKYFTSERKEAETSTYLHGDVDEEASASFSSSAKCYTFHYFILLLFLEKREVTHAHAHARHHARGNTRALFNGAEFEIETNRDKGEIENGLCHIKKA